MKDIQQPYCPQSDAALETRTLPTRHAQTLYHGGEHKPPPPCCCASANWDQSMKGSVLSPYIIPEHLSIRVAPVSQDLC